MNNNPLPKNTKTVNLSLAIWVVVFFDLVGMAIGYFTGRQFKEILELLLIINLFGGALVGFLWWVQHARAQEKNGSARDIWRSIIILLIIEIILWFLKTAQ